MHYGLWVGLTLFIFSHNYSEERMCQSLGMMGSYLGVSLAKDLRVAECEARTDLPICWQDAKDYLANHTEENTEFTFENLTGGLGSHRS